MSSNIQEVRDQVAECIAADSSIIAAYIVETAPNQWEDFYSCADASILPFIQENYDGNTVETLYVK